MRKRNAILLGLGFLLTVVAYVAWCWRPYYQRVPLAYSEDIPPEVVVAVKEWRERDPRWGPEAFELGGAISRLGKPSNLYFDTVWITSNSHDKRIAVKEPSACFGRGYFVIQDGKWKGYDFHGKPLGDR
jgi:hypothetical protein